MKLALLAVGLLALGTSTASAQRAGWAPPPPPPMPSWTRDAHPYSQRHHGSCHQKAWRLRHFERMAAADGRIGFRERQEIRGLQRDLDRTCGRHRWRD